LTGLGAEQRRMVATIAAAFSLFNIGGRIFWASMSDYMGRKATYYTFFLLGIALYASAPTMRVGDRKLARLDRDSYGLPCP
jgi:MFS family permease